MVKLTTEEIIQRSKFKHGEKTFDYSLTLYVGILSNITLICNNCKEIFQIRCSDHLSTKPNTGGCNICRVKGRVPYTKDEFVNLSNKKYNNVFDYSKFVYVNSITKGIIICPIHGEFFSTPSNHLDKRMIYGCPECSVQIKEEDDFKNESNIVHCNKYDYSKFVYKGNKIKGIIICKTHGDFVQSPNSHLKGRGCPECKLSKGSLKVKNWLLLHNIKYKIEYTYHNCINKGKLSFDFYLPDYNMLIEYDGVGHYKIIHRSKDKNKNIQNFIDGIINDEIKNEYCKNNDIPLLRIPYWEFENIDKILNDKLKENI